VIPVILSGGSGTRLWPLSRKLYPKQLLALTSDNTMLQDTLGRLAGLAGLESPIIICNNEHRFLVAEQLRKEHVQDASIILEPVGRNTAPAVTVAALAALEHDSDSTLLVMPADHVIQDVASFQVAVSEGVEVARQGKLITFGIVPLSAHTGFGYIERGEKYSDTEADEVLRFVEKPDVETAESYLASGRYLWNSGMFLFRASTFLEELKKYAPEIYDAASSAYKKARHDLDFLRLDTDEFTKNPDISIDYAVMEHTDNAVVIPMDAGWSDVGSWEALWQVGKQDAQGNVVKGDVLLEGATGCLINAQGRLVAAVGVHDQVIVETSDAILVADKSQSEKVKNIVNQLKAKGRPEGDRHRQVYRPWGSYDSIVSSDRFQVKLIIVNPGASLSLQMHHHRAEHWIVVEGTAKVTRGDEVFILSENESTYIPLGTKHRLENPGQIPLELIEVQSGSYLGEDDIVRFDDVYGRNDQ
jgi:mannose-1-phosphate guanylyltransferase / mannose-6-phosphate isomerase